MTAVGEDGTVTVNFTACVALVGILLPAIACEYLSLSQCLHRTSPLDAATAPDASTYNLCPSCDFIHRYNETDSVNVASLRHKGAASGGGGGAGGTAVAGDGKTRAEKEAERERKKRKREKKKEKMAEKEQLASQTQSSWQKFNGSKASKKSKTGFSSGSRESIFRTPDSVDGKVGIGTNNIGGRGMTGDFAKRDKWKLKQ